VNIKTRSFPDLYTLSISSSVGFNPNANLNGDFLSYPGGSRDIFGFDDGTRDLPEGVPTDPEAFPISNFLPDAHLFFDEITHKFSPILTPSTDKSFLNTGFSVDFGNSFYVNDGQLIGVVASLTYDLSFDHYDDGINARYRRDDIEVETLGSRYVYNDTRSTMSVSLGGLLSLAYQPSTNHEIALIVSSTQSAEDETRYQEGPTSDSGSDANSEDQVRSLVFTERNLTSAQLKGEHFFESNEIKVNWSVTSASSTQKDPDARYMNNEIDTVTGSTSLVKPDRAPRRVFRDLSEDQISGTVDVEIPVLDKGSLKRIVKVGGVINKKKRDFQEQVYQYEVFNTGNSIFSDFTTAEEFLDPEFLGVSDNPPIMKRFINFFRGQVYEGEEEITAVYGMLDFELNEKWRIIGGVRQENTDLNTLSLSNVDTRFFEPSAEVIEDKTLPSAQVVYKINDTQSIRASWSQTLARPTFREIAPYRSFPFIGGDEYLGNQNLQLTDIENYDLRWEWYPNPGEVISVGIFAKKLENPIEMVIEEVSGNFRQRPYNVDTGEIQGVEFEFRKNLFFIHEALANFSINANFTYTTSEVDNSNREFISQVSFFEDAETVSEFRDLLEGFEDEYGIDQQLYPREELLAAAPNTPTTRDLFGQPDIIANFSLSYDNPTTATSVSLNFNYVDQKLVYASQGATPDVYDAAREKLDLIIKQGFGDYWSIKFSAKNLTDSSKERFYDSAEQDIFSSYKSGRSFSLSATYKFQ
ncbi:MAG: TonB-dependent receptor, partial [Opitutales bacterium]|nr:TonB-dependent receptor [Opitutales bacterium]